MTQFYSIDSLGAGYVDGRYRADYRYPFHWADLGPLWFWAYPED